MQILFTFSISFCMSFIGASFNVLTCNSFMICLLLWLQCFYIQFLLLFALFIGLAYQGKDIVLILIIEYSSLRDFGP